MDSASHERAVFLGKVTASVSHDLQNVLAVIRESSGLMGDILAMSKEAAAPKVMEKLSLCLSSVVNQVDRGVAITSNLNGFAHTADSSGTKINLSEMLERLIFLTKRIFLHAGLVVDIKDFDKSVSIVTDPVLFQSLVSDAVKYSGLFCFEQSLLQISVGGNSIVSIKVQRNSDCNVDAYDKKAMWEALAVAADAIGGSIEMLDGDAGLCIQFQVVF